MSVVLNRWLYVYSRQFVVANMYWNLVDVISMRYIDVVDILAFLVMPGFASLACLSTATANSITTTCGYVPTTHGHMCATNGHTTWAQRTESGTVSRMWTRGTPWSYPHYIVRIGLYVIYVWSIEHLQWPVANIYIYVDLTGSDYKCICTYDCNTSTCTSILR